jgi:hypothetical protein
MNENIEKLGADAGLLNYVDHETPRHYFVAHWADQEEVVKYTELVALEVLSLVSEELPAAAMEQLTHKVLGHFGFDITAEKV